MSIFLCRPDDSGMKESTHLWHGETGCSVEKPYPAGYHKELLCPKHFDELSEKQRTSGGKDWSRQMYLSIMTCSADKKVI